MDLVGLNGNLMVVYGDPQASHVSDKELGYSLVGIGGSSSSINPGWWYTYPSEKYEFVSWYYYSQHMGLNNPHVPNHQPV